MALRPPGYAFLKPTQELLGSTPGVVYERLVYNTFQTLCTRVDLHATRLNAPKQPPSMTLDGALAPSKTSLRLRGFVVVDNPVDKILATHVRRRGEKGHETPSEFMVPVRNEGSSHE